MRGRMMHTPLLISSIIEHAGRAHPRQEVVTRTVEGPIHRTTWSEVRDRSRRLAGALAGRGFVEGDRLATVAWNTHRHLEVYYGVSGMGAIVHTLNPRLHPSQIAYIVDHAGDRALFVDTTFLPLVEALADKLPTVELFVVLCDDASMPDTRLPGAISYEALLREFEGEYVWPELDESAAAALCYTSGTTGNPKGVLYSNRSTVLHAWGVTIPDVFSLSASKSVLPIVPMFHACAWGLPYAVPLAGSKLVFPGPRLDPAGLTEQLTAEEVAFCAGVPSVFVPLLQHWREGGSRPPSLEMVLLGGAAPPASLIAALEDEFGIEFRHGWGMTETSPLGTVNTLTPKHRLMAPEERTRFQTKQGRPPFGAEVRVVAQDRRTVQPNDGKAIGELQIRGLWVVDGYFLSDEQKLTEDGWFPTGDVATIDEDHYVQITDRTKDLIKSGGEWISSIDVENSAMGHPDLQMAAVIGIPDEKWGERPLLVAVPRPGTNPTAASVIEFLAGSLAKWQLPDRVEFVDALPMGGTGKVQKNKLREQFGGS